jgi:hypothetical protein
VTVTGFTGIVIIFLFLGSMIFFSLTKDKEEKPRLRHIPAFRKIKEVIGLTVEEGSQLHVSLGRGGFTSLQSASALAGLSMLQEIIKSSSVCDYPPVASTGNATISILAQDIIQGTSEAISIEGHERSSVGELVGLTPFSYAVGTLTTIREDRVSANILAGWYGSEVTWLTTAGERQGSPTVAGTTQLPAQAIMYATANEPLIGEELYAVGAYLGEDPMHIASVNTQDVFRWLLVVMIIVGIVLKYLGLNDFLQALLMGSL